MSEDINPSVPTSSEVETSAEPKVLSVAEIKAKLAETENGVITELPSGLAFRLRRPSISKLLRADVIPSELIAIAIEMDSDGKYKPKNKEEYLKTLEVINIIVSESCVSPKVIYQGEAKDDEIHVDDISDDDKIAIFLYAQMGVKPYKSFRGEQASKLSGPDLSSVPGPQA